MNPEILSTLPNLSIGVVSILALVWVTRAFLIHLKEERIEERKERKEEQLAMRALEKEVRDEIMPVLSENTRAFQEMAQHLRTHRE